VRKDSTKNFWAHFKTHFEGHKMATGIVLMCPPAS